ncbi:flavohemoglobin expression-modulating QEGLA motif protein [soil metagenome]
MSTPKPDWTKLARQASAVISEQEPLRLDFGMGRLFIDHNWPALFIHRCVSHDPSPEAKLGRLAPCSAAHRLVTSQPAYLLARVGAEDHEGLRMLAQAAASALADTTGAVLVVEVWTKPHLEDDDADPFHRRPGFTLYEPPGDNTRIVADALADALSGVEIAGQGAEVERKPILKVAPPDLEPLVDGSGTAITLGLAVDAVFLNTREEEYYPGVLDALRAAMARPLHKAAESFAQTLGRQKKPLGRRHLEPTAELVDSGLADCARQYDFLLQVTPINAAEVWDDFLASGYDSAPEFKYRPLTFDPDTLRRDLFALPVERIEDPLVAPLLREKRDELGTEIQMIIDRETQAFRSGSLRLYGAPEAALLTLAESVLDCLADESRPKKAVELVGATAFAVAARSEIEYYQEQFDGFAAAVEVRDDIPGSLMVSSGQLLVGSATSISAARVQALLAHEVGTHVLTYYNACAQPLRQLRHGLAGYEALQEGIAVLSEWLVGGLTTTRMRILAARVLAGGALIDGADFVETFRLLRDRTGLTERGAFGVTLRIHRGGGLTKDIVYLRGLRDLLAYLGDDGPYWPLFVGKLSLSHIPAVTALRERGVLHAPPLRPRDASDPSALARLEKAAQGLSVLDLVHDLAPSSP